MMKKVIATISTLLICFTMLTGCGTDPLQADILNYNNNQVPTLVELENKVTTEYAAATVDKNSTDEIFAAKLKDVIIPAEVQLLEKAKAIVPATEEVVKVHNKYIAAITEQSEALNLMLQAAQNSDETLLATANEKMAHAGTVTKEYIAYITALKKR